SGILMPVFSLPSDLGAGDFGETAYNFIDFLRDAGQKVWQVLPLCQTCCGNSPYSSVCGGSFSPYYIALDGLFKDGLIKKQDLESSFNRGRYVDYGFLYSVRYPILKKAFSNFNTRSEEFTEWKKSGKYRDYALFIAIKKACGNKPFYEWDKDYKERNESAISAFEKAHGEDTDFYLFLQFIAEKQWKDLKKYANLNGIEIFGDLPLYVAEDSADVWKNPEYFDLDENLLPKRVAGVPPDYFSENGQLWGNPVYNYAALERDGFAWWIKRLSAALDIFDTVRIDHFRGLDRFYSVKAGEKTAKNGEWEKVPSEKLFAAVRKKIDGAKIVAEDLGIIDDGVKDLLRRTGYPGMKVLAFAFNGEKDNPYLPENLTENSVCYTGTHDNNTLKGYIDGASAWDKNNLVTGVKESLEKLGIEKNAEKDEEIISAIITMGFAGKPDTFIMPYQDVLGLGEEYRINAPGTVSEKNWSVRFEKDDFSEETAKRLKSLCEKYGR
ncbi:MAG: 4-alpha-glucanotransferase, partial [Clostridia bacterium]|nr:4-alpha-glucanotransferase [Clostridia bacterium]